MSSSTPPPFDPPDVVVTTPGALVTLFNDRGSSYGPQWSAEGVASRAAFVVADEADLLCQGGYVKDLTRLLDVSGDRSSSTLGVNVQLSSAAGKNRAQQRFGDRDR